jgi:tRNA-Thr(GGU) m(6)t(6)A37 methyltransferase TsaA
LRTELPGSVAFTPIGLIRTSFTSTAGMPIQADVARDVPGTIELDPAFGAGLADLEGFSHLILIYHLHEARSPRLVVTPFLDDTPRGIFATRSPARPNPIGLSTVRLAGLRGTEIDILDVDMVDGTPLLDIKPYVPAFDDRAGARVGWFAGVLDRLEGATADDRFRT